MRKKNEHDLRVLKKTTSIPPNKISYKTNFRPPSHSVRIPTRLSEFWRSRRGPRIASYRIYIRFIYNPQTIRARIRCRLGVGFDSASARRSTPNPRPNPRASPRANLLSTACFLKPNPRAKPNPTPNPMPNPRPNPRSNPRPKPNPKLNLLSPACFLLVSCLPPASLLLVSCLVPAEDYPPQ